MSRPITPEELRARGLAQYDDELAAYSPNDATLSRMGLASGNYDTQNPDERRVKKGAPLDLPPLPEIEETPLGKRNFTVFAVLISPFFSVRWS